MKFMSPTNLDKSSNVVWIAGKQTQVTYYLLNKLKALYVPAYFEVGSMNIKENFKENVISLNKNTSVEELNEISKEPPFLGSHYVLVGDYSDLSGKCKSKLLRVLKEEKPYIIALLLLGNYQDYKKLVDDKRYEDLGKLIYCYRPSQKLLNEYIRNYIKKEISDKAIYVYCNRTANQENFNLYLDTLKQLKAPITKEDVKSHIPNCNSYDIMDYLQNMFSQSRKTVHIKALTDILSIYGRKTYSEILNRIEILLHVKKLTLQGQLLAVTAGEDLERITENHLLPACLSKLNKNQIRGYLNMVSEISLGELHLIYLAFLNTKPNTHNLYILTDLIYNRHGEGKDMLIAICRNEIKI